METFLFKNNKSYVFIALHLPDFAWLEIIVLNKVVFIYIS